MMLFQKTSDRQPRWGHLDDIRSKSSGRIGERLFFFFPGFLNRAFNSGTVQLTFLHPGTSLNGQILNKFYSVDGKFRAYLNS